MAETLARVFAPVLADAPLRRPVAVLAADDVPALVAGTIRLVRRSGRKLAGTSEETVALRIPRAGRVHVPASWMGSTLVLVGRIGRTGATTRDALAHLARGLGASRRSAPEAGVWLATHVFASVLVLLEGAGRITAAALPHRVHAARALDAWLARRLGQRAFSPAGFRVRAIGDRGRWARASTLDRPLSLAARRRERP